jgi:hypothetical protein
MTGGMFLSHSAPRQWGGLSYTFIAGVLDGFSTLGVAPGP